jgi:oligoribonuclease
MIAWIDLETTGLSDECKIIEVACVVTDVKYNEVDSYNRIVDPGGLALWEKGAAEMHFKTGLWQKITTGGHWPINIVDTELHAMLAPYYVADGKPILLGGQSVHFDRNFIHREMPMVDRILSHRHLDVSVLRLVWSHEFGKPTDAFPPEKSLTTHKALEDIRASIDAMSYYSARITND